MNNQNKIVIHEIARDQTFEGHTQGPWYTVHEPDGIDSYYGIHAPIPGGRILVAEAEENADALLIAAAPTLLAENTRLRSALKDLFDHCAECVDDDVLLSWPYSEARAALAQTEQK